MGETKKKIGINLTGGGARGAYQSGALLALSEILKSENLLGDNNPFKVWSGISAGAINCVFCAAGSDHLYSAATRLTDIWDKIQPDHVFKTDFLSMSTNSVKWIRDLTFGSIFETKWARSLLNTAPLYDLINEGVFFGDIQKRLDEGVIEAVGISAFNFQNSRTATFVQSNQSIEWERTRRYSVPGALRADHVMASCAIPVLFPTHVVDGEQLGDGGFRNLAQLSPMIHMGAEKILVLGVRGPNEILGQQTNKPPGIAELSGMILNSLFFDSLIMDIERVRRINDIIREFPQSDVVTEKSEYSVIDFKVLHPSKDLSGIAAQKSVEGFPKSISFMLGGLGSRAETAELASYILFDTAFTRDLIELGYNDTISQKTDLLAWLNE